MLANDESEPRMGGDMAEPGMGVAMALALSSRSGLLAAMVLDESPRTAEEWSTFTRESRRTTEELLKSLVGGQVVEEVVAAGTAQQFHVPAGRKAEVKEMGAIFEALLMHQRDKMAPEAMINLVKFRCEKMLAGKVSS
jgi:hypothetical protein